MLNSVEPVTYPNTTVWGEFDAYSLSPFLCDSALVNRPYHLAYTPVTLNTTNLMSRTKQSLDEALGPVCCRNRAARFPTMSNSAACDYAALADSFKDNFDLFPFETEEALESYVKLNKTSESIFMAFTFNGADWSDDSPFPKMLNYSIRPPSVPKSERGSNLDGLAGWKTNILFRMQPGSNGPRDSSCGTACKPPYFTDGVMTAQHVTDLNFLRMLSLESNVEMDEDSFTVKFQRFPYPSYQFDEFIPILEQNLPSVILLCLIYLAFRSAKFVAIEKESGLKPGLEKELSD